VREANFLLPYIQPYLIRLSRFRRADYKLQYWFLEYGLAIRFRRNLAKNVPNSKYGDKLGLPFPAQTSQTIIYGFNLFAPSVAYIVGNNGYIAAILDSGVTWNSKCGNQLQWKIWEMWQFFDFSVGFGQWEIMVQISWSKWWNTFWKIFPKPLHENLNASQIVDSLQPIIVGNKGWS